MRMTDFTHFVGVDWSGAKGKRHAGIAVAVCEAEAGMPRLITPPSGHKNWSRIECAEWVAGNCGLPVGVRILVGFDSAFSLPFLDKGHFLPEIDVQTATSLWQKVEELSANAPDFFGGEFVNLHADHYLRTGNKGKLFERRMRVAETLAVETGMGPCESVFHLIGPSQVGMSGLSTMRLLRQLSNNENIAIWPFEDSDSASIVLVEIYAAAFAALGGHKGKVRDRETLLSILTSLGADGRLRGGNEMSDHAADALVTSAGLRSIAHDSKYWKPARLSSMVRRTEGWIFGLA